VDTILEFIGKMLLGLLVWFILFPVVWIICTPFILIISAFRPRSFSQNVSAGYQSVANFWTNYGIILIP
jgi:hypothetical protein